MSPIPLRALPFLLALALPLLGLSAPQAGKKDPRLEEAARLLRGPQEQTVRNGARLCAEIDNVDSMELMLDVLNNGQPHYRDIVWETLPDFKDVYARTRVATELARNKRNDRVRQWCAQLLGLYKDPGFGDNLVKALGDKEPHVQAAAARSLGQVGHKLGAKPLLKLVADPDRFVRAYAIEALATLDVQSHGALLTRSLKDRDGGVRCFLLGSAHTLLPGESEALSIAGREDPDWRVRMQAVENLGRIRTKTSIDTLVAAVDDPRPVVGRAAVEALRAFTGMQFTKPLQWQGWWEKAREGFAFPEGVAAPAAQEGDVTETLYNGLPVVSDHVAFLVDVSSEMQARLSSQNRTKAEAARAELQVVLERLEGRLTFNLFTYSSQTDAFERKAVALDAKSRKGALAFVEKATSRGAKDIWNAISTVVDDTELDTLYLLASGEPEIGLYVHYNRICEHLVELNRFHKVVVHGVVYSNSTWYRDQIRRIAEVTGGRFQAFE